MYFVNMRLVRVYAVSVCERVLIRVCVGMSGVCVCVCMCILGFCCICACLSPEREVLGGRGSEKLGAACACGSGHCAFLCACMLCASQERKKEEKEIKR
jgi:hypothetical protein